MLSSEYVTDIIAHKQTVAEFLRIANNELFERAIYHDDSKFSPEEIEVYEEVTPILKELEYGGPDYKDAIKLLGQHHYENNRHHPEHFSNGLAGMNLIDVLEMVCDWVAAAQRQKGGNIFVSLPVNKARFGVGDQLNDLIKNTVNFLLQREWDE